MHDGCSQTAIYPLCVKSTATHNLCKKPLVLMPTNVQIHRQVPFNDTKISKETKTALYKLLQKYDIILSKSNNDIGQTDLLKMHIATRPDAAQVAAQPYPFALKHHEFLKQEIQNLLDAGTICKSMPPW